MAVLLGINGEKRYGPLQLTPQQRRSRTLAILIDQLLGLAKLKPVLWMIEDVHWIDPTTLEFIELALDRVQAERVLILITARPTFARNLRQSSPRDETCPQPPGESRHPVDRPSHHEWQALARGARQRDCLADRRCSPVRRRDDQGSSGVWMR